MVFTADEAVEKCNKDSRAKLILVRSETTPDDIHGMEVAAGILTARGGMTSHAAVVARRMGKPASSAPATSTSMRKPKRCGFTARCLKEGDWISLDGTSGRVINGRLDTVPAKPDDPELQKLLSWAEPSAAWAFAPTPTFLATLCRRARSAPRASGCAAPSTCSSARTVLPHVQPMILADNEKDRRTALNKLLPMQRNDFYGVFRAMDGFPVTIRTIDPPLHEFLPKREDLMVEIARLEIDQAEITQAEGAAHAAESRRAAARVQPHARPPRLPSRHHLSGDHRDADTGDHRGGRQVAKEGVKVVPEIMIPLTGGLKEMANQTAIVRRVAEEVFAEKEQKVEYLVGTMIELPRAALMADEIAQEAEFFSFGTNDLTQMTFGFSRDDINKFLPTYAEGILKQDPFAVLDREGVWQLVKMAVEKGRKTRPTIKLGICGEHGGEPSSVEFCAQLGLNYVSCSPFRVLTARLAAAQAGASAELKVEGGRTK